MSISNAIRLSRRTLPAFASEGIFWGAFAAFAPVLKDTINASDGAFGWVLLAAATGAVTAMWLAPLFDARMGRFAMAVAALMLGLSFQLPMYVTSIVLFGALMVLVGATSGLLDVVMNARLSMIESRSGVSLMNLNHAMFSFAYAASALVTGLAREAGAAPWQVYLGLMGIVCLLAWRAMQSGVEQSEHEEEPSSTRLPAAVFWGGTIILAAFLAENAVEGWSALHIERTLRGGAAEGALGPAVLGLTMGFGRFAGQLVVARWSPAVVLVVAALLSASGALTAAFAPTPTVAYLGFGTLGLGVSVIAPMAFALVGRRVTDDMRARAISRAAVVGYFGFFIGPPIMGFVSEATSLRMSFVFIAAVLASIPVLTALLRRSDKPKT
ncbi:MFS transporter [Aliiroseovarius subalbicans]|uniref:MFS transporter n=1 Tax=Aliiroseovarius subalbicans TaxID=2925840 RepID=UPI001F5705CF|nr:MFS transporter [Aliiroseovarius subalbicans]MCI2400308.1 MFS transporter [Aliiroseovarius subalbicans]